MHQPRTPDAGASRAAQAALRRRRVLRWSLGVVALVLVAAMLVLGYLVWWWAPRKRRELPLVPALPPHIVPTTSCARITPDLVRATPQSACNPACRNVYEACVFGSAANGTPTCVVSCPSMCNNVPMGKMCIKGHAYDACLVSVPVGTQSAVMLQSAVPNAQGQTLAITAVGGGSRPCSRDGSSGSSTPPTPPTFVLQPASFTNTRQHFSFVPYTGKLCHVDASNKDNATCNGTTCPCNQLLAVDFYKPGQYGSSTAPFACASGSGSSSPFACGSNGMRVPCTNSYLVCQTANGNAAGAGWAFEASPALLSSSATATVHAVVAPLAPAWRELSGSAAHMFAHPVDAEYPAKGRRLLDTSFDRCEASRSVALHNANGQLQFQPTTTTDGSGSTATEASNSDVWHVLPIRMTPAALLNSFCRPTHKQTVPKPAHPPFDTTASVCCDTPGACKCARS